MSPPAPFTVTVERKDGNVCDYEVVKFPWHWRGYTVIDPTGQPANYTYLPTTDIESVRPGEPNKRPR